MTSVSGVTHREQKVTLQLALHTPHYTTVYTSLVCILMALKVRSFRRQCWPDLSLFFQIIDGQHLPDTHMFNHPLGLLWSYHFSWSSPLMHPQQQNHTICFQGSVLTTDKHSLDCGGNSFSFQSCSVCLCRRGAPHFDQSGCMRSRAALKGPF